MRWFPASTDDRPHVRSPSSTRLAPVPRRLLRLGWTVGLGLSLTLAELSVGVPQARAQDDWGLTREPAGRGPSRARPGPRPGPGPRGAGRPRARPRVAPAETAEAPGTDRSGALFERYTRILDGDPRETFAFRRLLDLYRERDGNIDRLVTDLSARVAADAEAYPPRMLLGHIFKAQSRLDEARASYGRAAELRPNEAAPRVALAQIERTAQNRAAARAHYDEALARTRERLAREELLREVAQLAMEMDDFEAARGYYQELTRGGEASVYLRTEYARALSSARQWDRAVEEYQRVMRALSGDNRVLPPILLELSRAQLERGDVEDSIQTLDRALRTAGAQAGIRAEIYGQMLAAYRGADRLPELADRLRREAGRAFEANELLGRIEDELGNDEAALEAYRRALRARAGDIDTRLRVIQLLSRSGRLDEVVEEYRGLIRSAPREPRFVIELAQLLMQTDHRDDALRLVRDAGRRHARDPVLHQQLAELYARWGEDALSAREIELLARIDPQDPMHVIALGAQQFASGDREAAEATWRRVLEVEADRASGHATLAGILADHDLLQEAVAQYREAVRLEPDELAYVRGLATTLERNRENDGAEQQWLRVLELAGDDRVARREARERIVGLWSRSHRLPARIQELERRFAAEPPDPEAGRFLAEAYRRRGAEHQGHAERVLLRIVEVEPGDVESLLALERIRRHRGDLAGAIETLRRLRDADPRRAAQYLQQMAEHALALYRDEEAVEYAAEAVQRNPEDASAHRRLGDLYRARQDMERAVTSYRRALELNERLYPVYFELAELHLARGETDQADRLYRQVLRVTPDDDLVARAARASVQINLGAGTLATLERDLLPLALGHPQRPVYRRLVVELYDAYATPLVAVARRGGPEGRRASEELHQIGTRGIKPLLEALADQDPAQRRVALDILGDLGNPNAAAPLLAVAETASLDLPQRTSALIAAGVVAPGALVPRFVALAQGDDLRLRGLATWGLARIGGRDASRALQRLTSAEDPGTRAFAALGLGVQGGDGAPRELRRLLRLESNEDVLFAAAWALGQAGEEDDAELLATVLSSRGGALARLAADGLGRVGGAQAEGALLRALFDPDAELREAAASALRGIGEERPRVALPPPHAFERPRDYVPRLLESARPRAAVSDLGRWTAGVEAEASVALAGPVERILAALSVLGAPGDGLVLGPLTADLDSWPDDARARAQAALDALAASLSGPLVALASHADAAVRSEVMTLLVRVSGPLADAAVAAALAEPPQSVQRAALDALAETERPPSEVLVERLAHILSAHRDWSMRTRAARALAASPDESARVTLREALVDDRYAFVREAAARALARGTARAGGNVADADALARALSHDPEARVRAEAAQGLLAMGGERAERARRQARSDASPRVRALVDP